MSAELLWEALRSLRKDGGSAAGASPAPTYTREPMQKVCAATTKSGKRCKGKARPAQDFCPFHDPSLSPQEAEASVHERRRQLLKRKEMGTEQWIESMG